LHRFLIFINKVVVTNVRKNDELNFRSRIVQIRPFTET
jgi:hypothetical protein